MEQLEIHSRSYLVRWVQVKELHTISWTIRPDKKSINFGIFQHPGGSGATLAPRLPSSTIEAPPTPRLSPGDGQIDVTSSHHASSKAADKLESVGLRLVQWYGTCDPNRVNTGTYDVPQSEGGMYALVFDNTFSKQHSKKATFVLLTYPTKSPPQTSSLTHHNQSVGAASSVNLKDSLEQKKTTSSNDSIPQLKASKASTASEERPRSGGNDVPPDPGLFTGTLQKRRRRKHQGWARRFFSLDSKTSTLSYYHDRNAASLRGSIPLSLAAIGANAVTRQISIDSGVEVWLLKASSQKDFGAWKRALEFASSPGDSSSPQETTRRSSFKRIASVKAINPEEDREWLRVEELLTKVRSSRDLARNVAKDTDPKYLPSPALKPKIERIPSDAISSHSSASESPIEQGLNGYFTERPKDRRPFWKRKPSTERHMPGAFRRSVSATPSLATPQRSTPTLITTSSMGSEGRSLENQVNASLHDRCLSLLRDLDIIISDFDLLLFESKQRRDPMVNSATSRCSIESQDDEFFDAEGSQLLDIHQASDEDISDAGLAENASSSSDSEADEPHAASTPKKGPHKADPAFPEIPTSLEPLPASSIKRRDSLQPPSVNPPSLIGFLRKNVGKDLSTISMPVSANEPISLLQRVAESLEYSQLLDSAADATTSVDRIILITAFAISLLSSARIKERAIRKPFNPMLGETFELVREDRGYRFLAEKVCHRPVRVASQADSFKWSLSHSPSPTQKFWGKSAELLTDGKFHVALHTSGEHFSWTQPTTFLRNIIAGEKYVEPVGSLSVTNESTGENACATFKASGMFSGRSEDVTVQTYDAHGNEMPLGLMGRWTSSLAVTDQKVVRQTGKPIWTVGELVPDAVKRYGFTSFAASLNEITSLEKDNLPPSDSRLRPDQRAAEDGDLDIAEDLKARLEEAQRQRRRLAEEHGMQWQPKWFAQGEAADGEEVWVQKVGKDGYWERRRQRNWEGVEKVFEVQ
ncbi:uncharacterized protein KY384_006067 [Bacidia gigantensis]|uniref:uncharacterized protein n=1 Tax=Bacidia gigantensis TaxID=2732470 RepID=UPI001D04A1F6|nr:uncharacterized protein KY384_006067 [Bacidia gigantensis]KAG8529430.1 hypothetical protein KY384_006067 [Bacidia gigantensis]